MSTIAPSYGTPNLATPEVRLSVQTQASLSSANLAVDEIPFSLDASEASPTVRPGRTIHYFASSTITTG